MFNYRKFIARIGNFVLPRIHTIDPEVKRAYVHVDKYGSAYIRSSELAQLPEVKEMQRMARIIVSEGKHTTL
ncbi:hypothetical protein ABN070_14945 [Morganella morganii]|uniref:hypothetical protein n=1 Tax=Morganella morganii TaxID=582 RepID=UPI0032DB6DC9